RGKHAVLDPEDDFADVGEPLEGAPIFFRFKSGQGGLILRVRRVKITARFPIRGAQLARAERADHAQGFTNAAADVGWARDRVKNRAPGVEDKGRTQRHILFVVEDAKRSRDPATLIGEQWIADAAEFTRPLPMGLGVVNA